MTDITLVSVNWNQKAAIELMLKSYADRHSSELLNVLIVDNGSKDGSKEWLIENEIPFVSLPENIGHEQAINLVYPFIKTKYALICDTDIEFLSNVHDAYLPLMNDEIKLIGDYITGDQLNEPVKQRVGAWFYLFDISAMKSLGVDKFRDSSDWSYDVGSWQTEKILQNGFKIHNVPRGNIDIDHELISMKYPTHDHIGKLSWDIEKHTDRESEILRRREYVNEKVKSYSNIELKGKFVMA